MRYPLACCTLVITLALPALGSPPDTDQAHQPQGFVVDQQFEYRIDSSGHQIVLGAFLPNGIAEEEYESHASLKIQVLEADDAHTKLSWTYERLAIEFASPVDPRRFDSDQPVAEDTTGNEYSRAFAKVIRPVVGAPIIVELNAAREVVSVSGHDALMPTADPVHAGWLMPLIGTDGIKSMTNTLFVLGADEDSLSPGDQWTKRVISDAPMVGEMETQTDHTLLATTDTEAIVATSSTVASKSEDNDSPYALQIDHQQNFALLRWDLKGDRARSYENHSVMGSSLRSGAGQFLLTFVQRIGAVE